MVTVIISEGKYLIDGKEFKLLTKPMQEKNNCDGCYYRSKIPCPHELCEEVEPKDKTLRGVFVRDYDSRIEFLEGEITQTEKTIDSETEKYNKIVNSNDRQAERIIKSVQERNFYLYDCQRELKDIKKTKLFSETFGD